MGILAIDVGEKRVGVAGTDDLEITVQPLDVFEASDAVKRIVDLAIARNVTKIIIGMPLDAQGNRGFAAKKATAFGENLKKAIQSRSLDILIEFWDESFTTKEAEAWLREANVKGPKRRAVIDKLAAAAILEDYLGHRG